MWEYKIMKTSAEDSVMLRDLTEVGKTGWELVQYKEKAVIAGGTKTGTLVNFERVCVLKRRKV